MRVIVIAAGEGSRWGNHLGVPKHLIDIEGEVLLARTVRQFGAYTPDVVVVGPDDRYLIPPARLHIPTLTPANGGVDKFLSSQHLWNPDGRTIVAYGDVWFSDSAVDEIVGFWEHEWQLFARLDGSSFTGCEWGECFAQSFWPTQHAEHRRALELVRDLEASGEIDRSGGWEHYRAMCGARTATRLGQHADRGRMTLIDDWTDDFDSPADYDRWLARRAHTWQ